MLIGIFPTACSKSRALWMNKLKWDPHLCSARIPWYWQSVWKVQFVTNEIHSEWRRSRPSSASLISLSNGSLSNPLSSAFIRYLAWLKAEGFCLIDWAFLTCMARDDITDGDGLGEYLHPSLWYGSRTCPDAHRGWRRWRYKAAPWCMIERVNTKCIEHEL